MIACLSISLIECLILLPAHLSHLPDPNAPIPAGHPVKVRVRRFRQRISHGMEWFVDHMYTPFLARAVRWRYVALCVAISVFVMTVGMVAGGFIKYEMFPDVDGDELNATIVFPAGTPLEVTQEAVARLEDALRRVAERTDTLSGEADDRECIRSCGGGSWRGGERTSDRSTARCEQNSCRRRRTGAYTRGC